MSVSTVRLGAFISFLLASAVLMLGATTLRYYYGLRLDQINRFFQAAREVAELHVLTGLYAKQRLTDEVL